MCPETLGSGSRSRPQSPHLYNGRVGLCFPGSGLSRESEPLDSETDPLAGSLQVGPVPSFN